VLVIQEKDIPPARGCNPGAFPAKKVYLFQELTCVPAKAQRHIRLQRTQS